MNAAKAAIASACLDGAMQDRMSFPQIVAVLTEAGFEAYMVDFRCHAARYYLPDEVIELPLHQTRTRLAPRFDAAALQGAIREAQMQVPGYNYAGFCEKAVAAGCAGYLVSFTGRRVLYFAGTGEAHTELFPS